MKKKTSIYILRALLFSGTFISLYFVPWILIKAWILPLPNNIEGQLEQSLNFGFDGMIVYVDEAGKEPQMYAAGWHNKEMKIPAKPDALFCIASITKLYVAVAITKLTHENKIDLQKSVASYFPEYIGHIEYADQITIEMLVKHRSGIPNFTDQNEFWQNPPSNRDGAIAYVLDLPANFKPNTSYGYSNTNYLLLAKLIEKITGKDQFYYIKEKILQPLGLTDTYGSNKDLDLDRVMSGYYVGIDKDQKHKDQGMFATAHDVAVFLRALNDGTVFQSDEQETYSSLYEYNHTGLAAGYQSIAKYHEDIDTVVIQFNNTTDFNGYQWNLAEIAYSRILKIIRKNKS